MAEPKIELPPPEELLSGLPDPAGQNGPPAEFAEPGVQEDANADRGWLNNFTDPGGNAPGIDPVVVKDWQPAVIRITRVKQYATACQYWLSMENRLPFKIRNMALRFSAYIIQDGYAEPVLFDSTIKSFSELRPTDKQFRDLFYQHANCDELDYIKVEDAGRCSVGELTKFSAQSGDCARFVEIQPSDLICVYLERDGGGLAQGVESAAAAEGAGRASSEHPCGMVNQADVDALLDAFESAYVEGDIDAFVALFDARASIDGGVGQDYIRQTYGELFRSSKSRQIKINNRSWRPLGSGSAKLSLKLESELDKGGFWGTNKQELDALMRVYLRGDKLAIASLLPRQK